MSAGRRTRTALEKTSSTLGRPRAFLQAAMTRAACDKAALTRGEFAVGDSVLACGQPGTLVGLHSDGSCTVEFRAGKAYEQVRRHATLSLAPDLVPSSYGTSPIPITGDLLVDARYAKGGARGWCGGPGAPSPHQRRW